MTEPTAAQPAGAFAPLAERAFLVLWLATVVANTGTWMRDTASGWLMTTLAPSAAMVSLVQAATTLPIFLLALPAGALADIVDRRKLMIVIQIGLALVTAALWLSTRFELMTPSLLLLLTLLGGIGAALSAPAWQTIVPELVSRPMIRPAVALNSLGVNISRAIGPAVGGLLIATTGIAAAYLADLVSYALIIGALLWWKRAPRIAKNPEQMLGAMRSGVRFALFNADLQRILLRAFLFFSAASAYWALLPLIVRQQLHGGATAYGFSMAAVGLGAISGALLLPRLRRRLSANTTVLLAALTTAAVMALLAVSRTPLHGVLVLFVAGAAWITVLSTLNAIAQTVLPDWVRGRGLAVYLTVFFGGMTAGSLFWGWLASRVGVAETLGIAAAVGALVSLIGHRWTLPEGDADLTPSLHWPEPATQNPLPFDAGPVMIRIVYTVSPPQHAAFATAIAPLGRTRRRDGAYAWGLMFDTEQPSTVIEWFLVESWAEHLRQHGRVSVADRLLQDEVKRLHEGAQPPRVEHYVDLDASTGFRAPAGDPDLH